jgi:heme exporter protein A
VDTPLLAFDTLACQRGGRLIFENLSSSVAPGAALLVRGANGSGKSSLLRLLANLNVPAAGHITRRAEHNYLGHDSALKLVFTVAQELTFWCKLKGDISQLEAALDAMALQDLRDTPCRLLSSGQRRRTALARMICSGVPLWLLDEPTVGLDQPSVGLLLRALTKHLDTGGGIIAATHEDLPLPRSHTLVLA